jgi:hypothetical protein
MILYRVLDLTMNDIADSAYDLVLFASGYEERCTYIPKKLNLTRLSNPVVLGFREIEDDPQRQVNDTYFSSQWGKLVPVGSNDDSVIYELLRREFPQTKSSIRILVDYSSMSRVWYTAILNWARFFEGTASITIDLLYSVGDHKHPTTPMVISEIMSLPGCEGLILPLSRSIAVFGLGFEGSAALCVLDRLEPDELYCYLAAPAAFKDYPERARQANREVIRLAKACLRFPLGSVERCYANLAELVSQYRSEANITLVPMGPKPHTLAAILVAMRFHEISCLRVGYRRHTPERVGTTGNIVATRVQFVPPLGARPIVT